VFWLCYQTSNIAVRKRESEYASAAVMKANQPFLCRDIPKWPSDIFSPGSSRDANFAIRARNSARKMRGDDPAANLTARGKHNVVTSGSPRACKTVRGLCAFHKRSWWFARRQPSPAAFALQERHLAPSCAFAAICIHTQTTITLRNPDANAVVDLERM